MTTIRNFHAGQMLAMILCLTVLSLTTTGCSPSSAEAAAQKLIAAADSVVSALAVVPAALKTAVLNYSSDAAAAAACLANAVDGDTGAVLAGAAIGCVADIQNLPPSIQAYLGPIADALQVILALFPSVLVAHAVAKKLGLLDRMEIRHAKSGLLKQVAALHKKIDAAR